MAPRAQAMSRGLRNWTPTRALLAPAAPAAAIALTLALSAPGQATAGHRSARASDTAAAAQASPRVLLVGSYAGIPGSYTTIQAAVDAARPGDWILVGPGDYKEQGYTGEVSPAGVLITTPDIHLRGMDRNAVVVDGTKPGAPPCSSKPTDQGAMDRNGVEVYKVNDTWVENLTVCNFLNRRSGGEQIWWNGGDGSGRVGLSGFWGNYLTATSSYSSTVSGAVGACCGVDYPAGDYGLFSSNATNGAFKYSYASNMADAAFYIGACQQVCDQVMQYDRAESSALCLSSTNAGGYLLIENTECDNNKTGLVSNSQNNDDWPSPQIGLCPAGRTGPLGTRSCTVWMNNYVHDNNNANVPGNGSGLAGGAPVGTGMILAGSTYVTLSGNTVTDHGAWGELIADLPDQETPPAHVPNPCQGGIYAPVPGGETCDYPAYGNVSENNRFSRNGFYGNPSNGDIGLTTMYHSPGNCFSNDRVPDGTDPSGIETTALYQPSGGMCASANAGDESVLTAEALCNTQLVFPCPGAPKATYPRPAAQFSLPPLPSGLTTMPDPCAGVPANPWCAGGLGLPGGAGRSPTSGSPAIGSCISGRHLVLHIRRRGLRRAEVFVNGRRVRVVRGRRLHARINLRGLPAGTVNVRVVAIRRNGRRITRARTYHTCAARRVTRRSRRAARRRAAGGRGG